MVGLPPGSHTIQEIYVYYDADLPRQLFWLPRRWVVWILGKLNTPIRGEARVRCAIVKEWGHISWDARNDDQVFCPDCGAVIPLKWSRYDAR
jgi:hypothetical protein